MTGRTDRRAAPVVPATRSCAALPTRTAAVVAVSCPPRGRERPAALLEDPAMSRQSLGTRPGRREAARVPLPPPSRPRRRPSRNTGARAGPGTARGCRPRPGGTAAPVLLMRHDRHPYERSTAVRRRTGATGRFYRLCVVPISPLVVDGSRSTSAPARQAPRRD